MKKAVILYSGGLDSTTCLAIAREEEFEPCALSFSYGQRHSVELAKAREFAPMLGVREHLVVDFDLRKMGGSALTSDIEVPKGRAIDDSIP
ncbi:MAG: 7-cyano-7-deazaguanine synthase, partial [Desulfuromonadales bacterium]